jgi:hypothetical protein
MQASWRSVVRGVTTRTARAYVGAMLEVMGRGLVAIGTADDEARAEIAGLPDGFTFEMRVMPSGPAFRLKKERGALALDRDATARPDLSIRFKHLRHALRVLSFVESTPTAFACDRLVIDGDVARAMRMQRILDRMQSIMLPRVVAARALKRVPNMRAGFKARAAYRLYRGMIP